MGGIPDLRRPSNLNSTLVIHFFRLSLRFAANHGAGAVHSARSTAPPAYRVPRHVSSPERTDDFPSLAPHISPLGNNLPPPQKSPVETACLLQPRVHYCCHVWTEPAITREFCDCRSSWTSNPRADLPSAGAKRCPRDSPWPLPQTPARRHRLQPSLSALLSCLA